MRIISQNGAIDVPYENFVFGILKDNCIVAVRDTVARPSEVCQGIVAEYSTEAKAQKAMEMLRTAYTGRFVTNADISDDFNEQLKELMKGGFGTVIVKDRYDSRVEFNNLNGYFQFPKDEDVEVQDEQ